jgi:hypothetical protein
MPFSPTSRKEKYAPLGIVPDCVRRFAQLKVISDEVYKYVVHTDGPDAGSLGSGGHVHFARLPDMWDRTLTVSSAGKTFSVTGWQVGWIIGPSSMVRDIQIMLPFVQFCPSTPMQEALVRCPPPVFPPRPSVPSSTLSISLHHPTHSARILLCSSFPPEHEMALLHFPVEATLSVELTPLPSISCMHYQTLNPKH